MTTLQRLPTSLLRASTPSQSLAEPLTPSELDVMQLLVQRLHNKEIANKLFVPPGTVKGRLKNICQKLEAGERREAVEKAQKIGIFSEGV